MKGLWRFLAVLATLGLMAEAAQARTVTIRNDGGGNITEYRAKRARLAKVDLVRIEGKCLSACTIFTTLPNACVEPDAKIGFHGASNKIGVPEIDYFLDMRMGEFYRGRVRDLYISKWRHRVGRDGFHVISGARLAQLDPKIRLCPIVDDTGG